MSQIKQEEFSGLRKMLWPIHSFEVKKFLPMGIMMFCILFIYTVLRDTKDAILVSAAGAESIVFAKGIGVTLSAIIFMILYTKAANIFKREGLFYATAVPFLVFFGLFPYAIYPFTSTLHMSAETIQHYQTLFPLLHRIIPLVGNWSYTLFYILSELWGSAVLSLLFWAFANAITPIHQARRFYGMFGFLGNFGLIFSGPAIMIISSYIHGLGLSENASTGLMLQYLMAFVIAAGAILLGTFYWMNRNVLTDIRHYNPEEMGEGKKKKAKLSMVESFKEILKSPYLGLIAMLVLAYGVSINLFEVTWKGQISLAYPNTVDFNYIMGMLSTTTGIVATILMLVGSNLLRAFSWRTCALITPLVLIVGSLAFFGVIQYNNTAVPQGMQIKEALANGTLDRALIIFVVFLGLAVNAFAKAVKYSLFDPTKEMAYIPLDPELKVKGKAAVDVIGGRGGKSAGSYLQIGLLTAFSGSAIYQLAPIIAPIAIGIVALWIASVFGLSKRFKAMTEQQAEKKEAEAAASSASQPAPAS